MGSPQPLTIAELFQSNLAEIGLRLEIETTDFATYVGIAFGDLPAEERPNLFPWFWQPDYNDGWNHLWPQVSCDAWQAGNLGHYCNQRVEALLEQARTAGDATAYQAALSEIQQILTRDDPAAIYTAQTQWLTVTAAGHRRVHAQPRRRGDHRLLRLASRSNTVDEYKQNINYVAFTRILT